ncbi:carboxylesterase/lipase family protein [Nonomuraea sp. NPDC050328]|uniref:carboxylesterase/lipase family protein n=1 Tax=Nonomuraea sp. NPDC050328 TaxID=3364361 RepID=UPI0037914684
MRTLLLAALLFSGCATDPAVVETPAGAVRGSLDGQTRTFQGIRYATAARWTAPKPAPAWKGVRDARKPGPMCPQVGSQYAQTASTNEDCLMLNVTAPRTAGSKRPVMVWVHGDGALGAGHFSDARLLAAKGVVVVTINYRLGVFSGFGHPGLTDGGTYGLQDQQEALRWVRRSITAFGGDPGNVTLFGVSYGALAISGHLTAPASAGLFHRAVMMSGESMMDMPAGALAAGMPAAPSFWRTAAEAEGLGQVYAKQLGCADLPCLRALPVERILKVPQIMNVFQTYAHGNAVLPESPAAALAAGRFHRMPVLAGATKDEHRLFTALEPPLTAASYAERLKAAFGEDAARVARRYPAHPSPDLAWSRVMTDRMWARGTDAQNRALAEHVPVYGYEFADRDAPMFLPIEPRFDWGAYHAGDLPYLFPEPGVRFTPEQKRLSERMVGYWTTFARTGTPNGPGLPAWPRLERGTQSLAPDAIKRIDYAAEHNLAFWR